MWLMLKPAPRVWITFIRLPNEISLLNMEYFDIIFLS